MTWATEMKNLVSDIKTSTSDRLKFVKDNQKDTHDLLLRFDKELKEMAQELKEFLDKSEKDRMTDFHKMMKDIQARVDDILEDSRKLMAQFAKENKERAKDVHELLTRFDREMKEMAKDLKDLLAKSEQTRMADFKTIMKEIQLRINDIQKHVADLLGDYTEERKEAHANWGVLRRKERAIAEEKVEEKIEEVKKEAKKAKKHKA